ncbi:hypothetical protein N2W54_001586, partial [Lotmaria passim]
MDPHHMPTAEATQHTPRSTTDGSGSGATPRSGDTPPDPSSVAGGTPQTSNTEHAVPHAPSAAQHTGAEARTRLSPQEPSAAEPEAGDSPSKDKSFEELLENLLAAEDRHRFQLECCAEDEMEDICDVMISQEDELLQDEFRRIDAEEEAEEREYYHAQRAREAAERGFSPNDDGDKDAKPDPFHEDEEDADARHHRRQHQSKSVAVAAEPEVEFDSFHEAPATEQAAWIERLAQPGGLPSSGAVSPLTSTLNHADLSSTAAAKEAPAHPHAGHEDKEEMPTRAQVGDRAERDEVDHGSQAPIHDAAATRDAAASDNEAAEAPLQPTATQTPRRATGDPQNDHKIDDDDAVYMDDAAIAAAQAAKAARAAQLHRQTGRGHAPAAPKLIPEPDKEQRDDQDAEEPEEALKPIAIFGPSRATGRPEDAAPHEAEDSLVKNASDNDSDDEEEEEQPLRPFAEEGPRRATGRPCYDSAPAAGESRASDDEAEEEEEPLRPSAIEGPRRSAGRARPEGPPAAREAQDAQDSTADQDAALQPSAAVGPKRAIGRPRQPGAPEAQEAGEEGKDASEENAASADHGVPAQRVAPPPSPPTLAVMAEDGNNFSEEDEDDDALWPEAIFGPSCATGRPNSGDVREAVEHQTNAPLDNEAEEEKELPLRPNAIEGPRRAVGRPRQSDAPEQQEEEHILQSSAVAAGPKRASGLPPRSTHAFSGDAPSATQEAVRPLARAQSDYVRGGVKRHISPNDRPEVAASAEVARGQLVSSARAKNSSNIDDDDAVYMDDAAIAAAQAAKAARAAQLHRQTGRGHAPAAPKLIPEPDKEQRDDQDAEEPEEALKPIAIFGPSRATGRPEDAAPHEAEDSLVKNASDNDSDDEEEEEQPLRPFAEEGPRRATGRPCYDSAPAAGESRASDDEAEEEEEPLRPSAIEGPRRSAGRARPEDPPAAREAQDAQDSTADQDAALQPSAAVGPKRAIGRPRQPGAPEAQEAGRPGKDDGDAALKSSAEERRRHTAAAAPMREGKTEEEEEVHMDEATRAAAQAARAAREKRLARERSRFEKERARAAVGSLARTPTPANDDDDDESPLRPSALFGPTRATGRPYGIGSQEAGESAQDVRNDSDADEGQPLPPSYGRGPALSVALLKKAGAHFAATSADSDDSVDDDEEPLVPVLGSRNANLYRSGHVKPKDYEAEESRDDAPDSGESDNSGLLNPRLVSGPKRAHGMGPRNTDPVADEERQASADQTEGDDDDGALRPSFTHPARNLGATPRKGSDWMAGEEQQLDNADGGSDDETPLARELGTSRRPRKTNARSPASPKTAAQGGDSNDNVDSDVPLEVSFIYGPARHTTGDPSHDAAPEAEDADSRGAHSSSDSSDESPLEVRLTRDGPLRSIAHRHGEPLLASETVSDAADDSFEREEPLAAHAQVAPRRRAAGPLPRSRRPSTEDGADAEPSSTDDDDDRPLDQRTSVPRKVRSAGSPRGCLPEAEQAESPHTSDEEEEKLKPVLQQPKRHRAGHAAPQDGPEAQEEQSAAPTTPSSEESLELSPAYGQAQPKRGIQQQRTPSFSVEFENPPSHTPHQQALPHQPLQQAPGDPHRLENVTLAELAEAAPPAVTNKVTVKSIPIQQPAKDNTTAHLTANEFAAPVEVAQPPLNRMGAPFEDVHKPLENALQQRGEENEPADRNAIPEHLMGAPG